MKSGAMSLPLALALIPQGWVWPHGQSGVSDSQPASGGSGAWAPKSVTSVNDPGGQTGWMRGTAETLPSWG